MTSNTLSWYALRVQSRLARLASTTLRGKGYEEFFPTCRSRHRWSDRIKEVETPLFPGYIFCRFDPDDRAMPIVTTPGVIGFVGAGKKPTPIADEEIDKVRSVVQSGLAAHPCAFVVPGDRLYITRGPLAGLEGSLLESEKGCRLVISISLLQRSIAVAIDRDWARPSAAQGCS